MDPAGSFQEDEDSWGSSPVFLSLEKDTLIAVLVLLKREERQRWCVPAE